MHNQSDGLYVGWLFNWLDEQGVPCRELLSAQEIPDITRGYRYIELPVATYLKLVNRLAVWLSDDCVGLRIGLDMDLRDYGYAGELLHYCASLRECCLAFEKYCKTLSPRMHARFYEGKRTSFLQYEILGFDDDSCRQDTDVSFVAVLRFFQLYIGKDWLPSQIQLKSSPPEDIERYVAIYGDNVRFNQPRNAIHFPNWVLDTPVSDTDPYLLSVLLNHVNGLLEQITARDELVAKVRYNIACNIGNGDCSASQVAQRLCMSHRTLNRSLNRLGTSFRQLKASVMEEMAKAALAESDISITAIALQLGYSEVAAFDHAFKKQTGLSPSAYRIQASRQ